MNPFRGEHDAYAEYFPQTFFIGTSSITHSTCRKKFQMTVESLLDE